MPKEKDADYADNNKVQPIVNPTVCDVSTCILQLAVNIKQHTKKLVIQLLMPLVVADRFQHTM
jgi:hypothetical protein